MNRNLTISEYSRHYLPSKYWDFSFSDFLLLPVNVDFYKETVGKIKAYVDHKLYESGYGLLIHGPFRSGKTAISVATAKYAYKTQRVMPYFVSNWFFYSVYFGKENISFSDLLTKDLIILDDIGREYKNKDFAGNVFEDFVRERINRNLGTIITTNLTIEELKDVYGTAFYSLLNEMFCLKIKMKELRDGFIEISKNKYQKLGGIL